MLNDYMKKYREQMDKVTLSDSADQNILDDLLKSDAQKGVPYMKRVKRNISAAMIAATIIIASAATVFAGVVIHGIIIKSNNAESQIEGLGARVDVGKSYYYDLLAGDTGEIYALTDNDEGGALTDHHVIAWKSTDQGDTWEEILSQPEELNEGSGLLAGDLREGEAGVEAIVLMEEKNTKAEDDGYTNRVYQITTDSCIEYNMDEVYRQFGGQNQLFNIKYVSDHIIALIGQKECLIYDLNTQKVRKSLPYDLSMGCLKTQEQFLIYGKEIYSCLNIETLEEQEPEEGLQKFVKMMYEKNNKELIPPMDACNDTIVCVTQKDIYEYRAGEMKHIRQLSNAVNEAKAFHGWLPICKTQDGKYYVCTSSQTGMTLWQIDENKEEMK